MCICIFFTYFNMKMIFCVYFTIIIVLVLAFLSLHLYALESRIFVSFSFLLLLLASNFYCLGNRYYFFPIFICWYLVFIIVIITRVNRSANGFIITIYITIMPSHSTLSLIASFYCLLFKQTNKEKNV